MQEFNHIFDWRLLRGPHFFPGPDGGTCVTEAAIVAAGFDYRPVYSADALPPCFSRVVAGYAIGLNDAMPDDLRQEYLKPYVTRLAFTAETLAVETLRAHYITMQTVNRILPIMMRQFGFNELAEECEHALSLSAARAVTRTAMRRIGNGRCDRESIGLAAEAAARATKAAVRLCRTRKNGARFHGLARKCIRATVHVSNLAAVFSPRGREVWGIAAEILGDCITMGKQRPALDNAVFVDRLMAARQSRELVH